MTGIGRRNVLKAFPAAIATGALAATEAGAVLVPKTVAADAFPQPEVRRSSRKGVLSTRLDVRFTILKIPGLQQPVRTRAYEASVPGPTLRVRAGDRIELTQVNALPPDKSHGHGGQHNVPHDFNTFNLHTHGMHVDPKGMADNVLLTFPPAPREGMAAPHYLSVIDVPRDHPEGTFWYHPHHHGSSATQLAGGMAGVIVVEGDTDRVPQIAAARDVVVCINELKLRERTGGGLEVPDLTAETTLSGATAKFLVNGAVEPVITAAPGEVQRWRLVNAGGFTALTLELQDQALHEIARDGITFMKPAPRKKISLPMGGRSDVLVQPKTAGTYHLKHGNLTLMTLKVQGTPASPPMELPTTLPGRVPKLRRPDHRRTLIFRSDHHALPPAPGGFRNAYRILGTGHTPGAGPSDVPRDDDLRWGRFDPAYVNHTLRLGDVEEWTLTNPSTTHPNHPFHLHTNHFLVVSVDGKRLDPPIWHDTIQIPPEGKVVIRVPFEDFTGTTVLHCHQLQHEDEGMMQLIQYVSRDHPPQVNPTTHQPPPPA
ncbi:multicopper oxidase family protein [Streptomyces roseolus]|uniref:multicopper oxidase family protein n=1 Tax=Streptomyces roseolus TaxID=67358 RepID=UPI003701D25E